MVLRIWMLTLLWSLPPVHKWNSTSVVLVLPQKMLFKMFSLQTVRVSLNLNSWYVSPVLGWQSVYSFCPLCTKLFDVYCEECEYVRATIYMVCLHRSIQISAVGVPDRKDLKQRERGPCNISSEKNVGKHWFFSVNVCKIVLENILNSNNKQDIFIYESTRTKIYYHS